MAQPNPFMPRDPQAQQAPAPQQQAPAPQAPQQYAPQPQQAPAPQAYAPQQPQQYAPAPQAPQQYAPQQAPAQAPQQYAPAPQQQAPQQYAPTAQGWPQGAAPAAANGGGLVARPGQFVTPPPPSSGGGARPRLLDMYGRLLIVLPEHVQRGVASRFTNRDGSPQTQDKLTATVIVLDGGPLAFGGEPEKGPAGKGQHTQQVDVPYVIKGLWINQSKLIEQLEEALAMRLRGEPGLALGRLWKVGNAQNDPWVLAAPTPEDIAAYDRYVSQVNPFSL